MEKYLGEYLGVAWGLPEKDWRGGRRQAARLAVHRQGAGQHHTLASRSTGGASGVGNHDECRGLVEHAAQGLVEGGGVQGGKALVEDQAGGAL